jgi:hypothetical protein
MSSEIIFREDATLPAGRAERDKRYRATHPDKRQRQRKGDRHKAGYARPTRSAFGRHADAPFVGCDGEGSGLDDLGRQNYMLLRIGTAELYTGKPLTTAECLEHICQAPPGNEACLVGFSFGYDATMILRDLSSERRIRLLQPPDFGAGRSLWTYWGDYGIEYLPRQHLAVCRLRRLPNGKIEPIKGSQRKIFETFGFFQKSFLRALRDFDVGREHLEMIASNKAARSTFDVMTDEVRDYCRIECDLLAQMMERLREACYATEIRPSSWNGAGKLAKAMHKSHGTITAKEIERIVPAEALNLAKAAYYGGRFEITRTGKVAGPIYEYDIRSAYPAAMSRLPCLEHGGWSKFREKPNPASDVYVASVAFDHDVIPGQSRINMCGLPIRSRFGHISWPVKGSGQYWSCEIESAKKLGAKISWRGGWQYIKKCDCQVFPWVNEKYEARRSLGGSTKGYPLKLAINSLYGAMAQRIGRPVWGNFIWAGLVTAITRSTLNEAIAQDPSSIVMVATDGIYSRKPLALPLGSGLGQWEAAEYPSIFIVQPGLYWPPKPSGAVASAAWKKRTRGVPARFFEACTDDFERVWLEHVEHSKAASRITSLTGFPEVQIEVTSFTGLKLAQSRGKPDTAGKWGEAKRRISFDWTRKRSFDNEWEDQAAITRPLIGDKTTASMIHVEIPSELLGTWEGSREELEDQPDYVDLSPPWKD